MKLCIQSKFRQEKVTDCIHWETWIKTSLKRALAPKQGLFAQYIFSSWCKSTTFFPPFFPFLFLIFFFQSTGTVKSFHTLGIKVTLDLFAFPLLFPGSLFWSLVCLVFFRLGFFFRLDLAFACLFVYCFEVFCQCVRCCPALLPRVAVPGPGRAGVSRLLRERSRRRRAPVVPRGRHGRAPLASRGAPVPVCPHRPALSGSELFQIIQRKGKNAIWGGEGWGRTEGFWTAFVLLRRSEGFHALVT